MRSAGSASAVLDEAEHAQQEAAAHSTRASSGARAGALRTAEGPDPFRSPRATKTTVQPPEVAGLAMSAQLLRTWTSTGKVSPR